MTVMTMHKTLTPGYDWVSTVSELTDSMVGMGSLRSLVGALCGRDCELGELPITTPAQVTLKFGG